VSDYFKGTVFQVNPTTGAATTFATGFASPRAIAFDASGNLYVANYANGTISQVSSAGVATTFAQVPNPIMLAFDTTGDLYVTSLKDNYIYKVDQTGAASRFMGPQGVGGLAFSHPFLKPVAAKPPPMVSRITTSSEPEAKPSKGLIFVLSTPAIILVIAILIWLVPRKKEAKQ